MSGVTGASWRSIAGSPAWTAIVSGCGIASAYLTPLVATHLEPIAQALENRQACIELGVIASEQGPFTSDPGGIRHGFHVLPDGQRPSQHRRVAPDDAESPPSLRLEWTEVPLFRPLQELAQALGRQHLSGVEHEVQTALSTLGQTGGGLGHLAHRLGDGAQVVTPITKPAAEVTVGRKCQQDGIEDLSIRLGETIILPCARHVDRRHEPTHRIARRRLLRLQPELPSALTHEESLVPPSEQGQDVGS